VRFRATAADAPSAHEDSQEEDGREEDATDSGVRLDTLDHEEDEDELFPEDVVRTPSPVHSSTPDNSAPADDMDDSPPADPEHESYDEIMEHI
jgi:hypothetical protein